MYRSLHSPNQTRVGTGFSLQMPCLVSRGLHHSLPARSPLITFRQQMSARVKPPNILVQVKVEGEPGAGGLLQRVRRIVSREMYVVYPILSGDNQSNIVDNQPN